jgi:hypothetical protein
MVMGTNIWNLNIYVNEHKKLGAVYQGFVYFFARLRKLNLWLLFLSSTESLFYPKNLLKPPVIPETVTPLVHSKESKTHKYQIDYYEF